jgi:hypothetical protein
MVHKGVAGGGCVLWKNRKNEAMGKEYHLKATVMEVIESLTN